MGVTPFSQSEVRVNAGVTRVAGPLVIPAGATRATIEARLVSSDWLPAASAATGTVTLVYQVDWNDGQGFRTFDTNTAPNNLYLRSDGGLPGAFFGFGDGVTPLGSFSLRVLVTPSLRMLIGCTGQVTTEP